MAQEESQPSGTEQEVDPKEGSEGKEGGEQTSQDWRQSIQDEDARKHSERFNSIDDLAKANLTMRKKLSGATLVPGKDASEDEVKQYRKHLGVPETPEGYAFTDIEGKPLPEELKPSVEKWQRILHERNVSSETAQVLVRAMAEEAEQSRIELEKQNVQFAKESEEELRGEWTSDYDKNIKLAEFAGREILGEEDYEDLKNIVTADGRPVTDHPQILRMLSKMGREMEEGDLGGVSIGAGAEDIDEKIQAARTKVNMYSSGGSEPNAKLARKYDAEEARLIELKLKYNK
jgi:hypothetical protein